MYDLPLEFCPNCGADLVCRRIEGRERKFCKQCERPIYRNPKPCAGVLVVDNAAVLLVTRTRPPAVGSWSLPAGYLEADEPPRNGAVRELAEETSLAVESESLTLLDTAFVEHPCGSYVLVLVYTVSRQETVGEPVAGTDAGAARFWRPERLVAAGESIEPGYLSIFERAIGAIETIET
jgi:ADP-ribose pyrophosphatase YjhB (NUDIX family)